MLMLSLKFIVCFFVFGLFLYCLKNEQQCIIRFKNSRRSREFLNLIIHVLQVF